MKEWEYTFDSVSKADWIKQIETDLRQKSVDNLSAEWWPGEPLNPILHGEDLQDEIVSLPSHLFDKPPLLVETITIRNLSAKYINQKILDALQFGAQSILIKTADSEHYFHPEWLSNVIPEIITFQIECDFVSYGEAIKILQNTPDFCLLRLNRTPASVSVPSITEQAEIAFQPNTDRLRFVYTFETTGNIIAGTSAILKKILVDLEEYKASGLSAESFLSKCILRVHPDADYFKHIILSRTLQLLWLNLVQWNGDEINSLKSSVLETYIDQYPEEEPDSFLIRASMSGLAASLTGTNALGIHGLSNEANKDFYQRINRNIHHLLHLESGMYKGKDPLAGAYAIDYHTRKWVSKIWSSLDIY